MASNLASEAEQARIMLGVLEAADACQSMSQRRLAADLGIALGLVNAYVRRCVRKGLLKVSQVPARRYAYYLTPEGFAEKSRLTAEYLSFSLSFFRQARSDCADEMARARAAGWRRLALAGATDVAEIAALCAIEAEIEIVAVVDPCCERTSLVGLPVVPDWAALQPGAPDAILVTAIRDLERTLASATAAVGSARVLIPALLGARVRRMEGAQ